MQVQRSLRNEVKPLEYSNSVLTMERGEPSTRLDKQSGIKVILFTTDLSK